MILADDFVIGQLLSGQPNRAQHSLEELAAEARDCMTQQKNQWKTSLDLMGTCAYQGTVPKAAIKRVCYIDFSKMNPAMFFEIADIKVTVNAFSLCANKYRMVDAWFWGGEVTFGYGLVSNHKLKQLTDHNRVKKAFNELWSGLKRFDSCQESSENFGNRNVGRIDSPATLF